MNHAATITALTVVARPGGRVVLPPARWPDAWTRPPSYRRPAPAPRNRRRPRWRLRILGAVVGIVTALNVGSAVVNAMPHAQHLIITYQAQEK